MQQLDPGPKALPDAATAKAATPPWRLRTWHLFAWTAATAAMVASSASMGRAAGQTALDSFLDLLAALAYPPLAVAMCIAAEGLVRCYRGEELFPAHPGEIVICLVALRGVNWLQHRVLSWSLGFRYAASPVLRAVSPLVAVGLLIVAVVLVVRYVRQNPRAAWTPFLLLKVSGMLLSADRTVLPELARVVGVTWRAALPMAVSYLLALLTGLAFCWAVVRDHQTRTTRPWTHWAGVAIVAYEFAINYGGGMWLWSVSAR
ncbi:MAG: hypothetical protein CMJ58_20795 [Planctomycetaceae bacterium]|nr:hypothetical protein [Planctomycetaceae bacterium]